MKTIFRIAFLAAASGLLAQCTNSFSAKKDYFAEFENRKDIKALLDKAYAGNAEAQLLLSDAYRDRIEELFEGIDSEKEREHVAAKASLKRMFWLEKAAASGEEYAMDLLADFYSSGCYGEGKFNQEAKKNNIANDRQKAIYWTSQLKRHTKDSALIREMDWRLKALKNGEDISDRVGKCDM